LIFSAESRTSADSIHIISDPYPVAFPLSVAWQQFEKVWLQWIKKGSFSNLLDQTTCGRKPSCTQQKQKPTREDCGKNLSKQKF